jgi:hypothetical protein
MAFPIVPLPQSWIVAYPKFPFMHEIAGALGAGGLAFMGLVLLAIFVPAIQEEVPGSYMWKKWQERIRFGYMLLGIAVAFVFFGGYLMAVLISAMVIFLIYVTVNGIGLALTKTE